MKFFAIVALSVLPIANTVRSAIDERAVPFQVTISHVDTKWTAKCTSGCKWDEVSVTCERDCALVVDDRGMRTLAMPRFQDERFAFIVEAGGRGWHALQLTGTAWLTVAVNCGDGGGSCSARVNELGISGI